MKEVTNQSKDPQFEPAPVDPEPTPTPPEEGSKFWEGTNFYIVLILLFLGGYGMVSESDVAAVTAAVTGVASAIMLVRQIAKKKDWSFRNLPESANNWNYLAQLLTMIGVPGAVELIPALQDLLGAILEGNYPAIISAALSLVTLIYYLFFQDRNRSELQRLAGVSGATTISPAGV